MVEASNVGIGSFSKLNASIAKVPITVTVVVPMVLLFFQGMLLCLKQAVNPWPEGTFVDVLAKRPDNVKAIDFHSDDCRDKEVRQDAQESTHKGEPKVCCELLADMSGNNAATVFQDERVDESNRVKHKGSQQVTQVEANSDINAPGDAIHGSKNDDHSAHVEANHGELPKRAPRGNDAKGLHVQHNVTEGCPEIETASYQVECQDDLHAEGK